MERKKVEFIESYIKVQGGDYQWSDNHGYLTRCRDCAFFTGRKKVNWCDKINRFVVDNDYCSWAERIEPKEGG